MQANQLLQQTTTCQLTNLTHFQAASIARMIRVVPNTCIAVGQKVAQLFIAEYSSNWLLSWHSPKHNNWHLLLQNTHHTVDWGIDC